MGRFAIMTLTDAAAERVREIQASHEDALGIRVGVKKGGCAGMEYTIALAEEAKAGDDLIELDGAKVYIAPEAALFLLGTQMDFEVTTLRTGFVFNNPNQTSACGCGESVELTPVSQEALDAAHNAA
ncbi:Fe-S cluster assembly scaffold SufA [Pseudochrobactrum asaccharolyticum]|jgi:iron-sulfur cluster assembly protein|uniref:Iron-sulfur cluster assembly protein n=1 Tax=Pseudochrobactrum asaccharolyticum TaxID=354351 RepID=A0A366DRT6_9HYPH|nr:Fe-S cluster assembly scaffold SufA [Pseudochrobactrum asaccharolyticum]MBX8800805.1 Fe-S cluster assembly scaffold SufA [Ochrobactrum sp. MR28]MBX8815089.1 Fe-S cluster assembly scaffold SufA [Ochrobactrum sp. MR31]MDR2311780.1 Fe-S cluster assembly scaffold SufA [Brucellaceae bacterium]RBO91984.1 iron-sulfur cluster assembly protein [Pseudochrobactrum asaccharolyticum]